MSALRRQRGVALLAAIMLVALGTILAATIAFQSAMAARRGTAALSFEHSQLVAQGAEALAAVALREDRNRTIDDFSEGWAQTFGPMEIAPGIVLEASLEDLQGRFNLNSLIDANGVIEKDAVAALRSLLQSLELEPKWADQIADWIDLDVQPNSSEGLEDVTTLSQDPPYRTANTLITSPSELLALPEFGRERYQKLAPYVTALPRDAKLNVCTAAAILVDAMVEEGYRQYSNDEAFPKDRQEKCAPNQADFLELVTNQRQGTMTPAALQKYLARFGQTSNYFRLTSHVSLGGSEFTLYSVLKRGQSGSKMRVVQRSFTPD